jgi:hypothetical protein
MSFKTPIILFIYNRAEITRQVFDMIRSVHPKELFIIADGPKNAEDEEKVKAVRKIIEQVDWDCNLKTNISERNLGCAERIISGLDWVFSQVDNGIILEDDCLPDPSFFYFCESLLHYYKFDERVMHISGFNCLNNVDIDESYFYSRFLIPPWGWATWKRAWLNFNKELDTWQQIKKQAFHNIDQNYFADWTDMFENIRVHKTTWDVPWNIDVWKHNGLSIIPKKSLVQNIGFGPQATFTKNTTTDLALILGQTIEFPLVHPTEKIMPFENAIEDKIISALKLNSNSTNESY